MLIHICWIETDRWEGANVRRLSAPFDWQTPHQGVGCHHTGRLAAEGTSGADRHPPGSKGPAALDAPATQDGGAASGAGSQEPRNNTQVGRGDHPSTE